MNKRLLASIVFATFSAGLTACHGVLAHNGEVHKPAPAEFGYGPRASSHQLYKVTLRPTQSLKLRAMLTVPFHLTDAEGHPVEDAVIRIDGGMPEHGHGLPTQPRVKQAAAGGLYEIEGMRFSMGGWWELKLAIESPRGADSVTLNLAL